MKKIWPEIQFRALALFFSLCAAILFIISTVAAIFAPWLAYYILKHFCGRMLYVLNKTEKPDWFSDN